MEAGGQAPTRVVRGRRAAAFRRGLAKAAPLLACLGAVVVAASTLAMTIRSATPLPVNDQWDNLVAGRPITVAWLVSQHAEHRLLVARLIFILDRWLSDETFGVDLAANVAMQAITTTLLLILARPAIGWTRPTFLLALGVAVAATFSALQYENFTWGFQVQFFAVCLAAVATFAVGAFVASDLAALIGGVVIETLATGSLASGLIVPYAALVTAVLGRRPLPFLIAQALAALALTLAYLHGYTTPGEHSDPLKNLGEIGRVAAYAMAELGAPFVTIVGLSSVSLAVGFGGIGLLLLGLGAWRLRQEPAGSERRRHLALLAVAVFVLAMALLTGLGRLKFGLGQAFASRYATPVLLFWLALLLSALSTPIRAPRREALLALSLLLVLVLVIGQWRLVDRVERIHASRDAALPAILAGVADADMLTRIYPDAARPLAAREVLRQAGAAVFAAPWARLDRSTLPDTPLPPCGETEVRITEVGSEGAPGFRVTGRLPPGFPAPIRILMRNGKGNVVGYGAGPFQAATIARNAAPSVTWWIGEIAAADPAAVAGIVLGPDDQPRCTLAPFGG